MKIVTCRNVNDAWPQALEMLNREGDLRPSRNGNVTVHPSPVTTVYRRPRERVLLDPHRDANPMFHLHEALWLLAGQDNARWLDQFVRDFSQRYGEGDGRMHGAYGKRWRNWFGHPAHTGAKDSVAPAMLDQLDEVVRLLRADPYDRQCVIQMWDPSADLGVPGLLDRPCNTQIYLRCDRVDRLQPAEPGGPPDRVLDLTVTCRSNDIVYGCYGANVVHFSVLQEYLAARIGVGVGRMYQMSNNWHMYDWARKHADQGSAYESAARWGGDRYPGTRPLVYDPETFDAECRAYVAGTHNGDFAGWKNRIFEKTAWPMMMANTLRMKGGFDDALAVADRIAAPDWREATVAWLERRRTK